VLDVGCGGGLPSVVFAIACPQWRITAIDAVAKKTAFVQTVAHTLKLTNLNVIHGRVEELSQTFDLVTCRAFAELADFTHWTAASLNPSGRWLAMKGKYPQAEIERLPKEVLIEKVQTLRVPGLGADRCLVWLSPNR
jgi:16S rRNA (guanine527-N7)-methyltransferase